MWIIVYKTGDYDEFDLVREEDDTPMYFDSKWNAEEWGKDNLNDEFIAVELD